MIAMDMPVSGIYDDYLMHHGIKGMKWGVRRYQNEDGSLTEAGKRRYGTAERFNDEYVKPREERKAARAAKRTERLEKRKERAISKGNIDKILKYAPAMTSQELQDAANRARNIKSLKELGHKKSAYEKVVDFAGKVSKLTNTVADAGAGTKRLMSMFKEEPSDEEKAEKEGRLIGIKQAAKNQAATEYAAKKAQENSKDTSRSNKIANKEVMKVLNRDANKSIDEIRYEKSHPIQTKIAEASAKINMDRKLKDLPRASGPAAKSAKFGADWNGKKKYYYYK